MMSDSFIRKIFNFIFLPLRIILKPEPIKKMGLTPISDERHIVVAKYVKGKLLDVGCGNNLLAKNYSNGIGVDVYKWEGIDALVDTRHLPFESNTFDTITFMANLNHIPEQVRTEVLEDAKRVLKNDGQILFTMLTPKLGYIGHKYVFGWRDEDQIERGMKEGESFGLSTNQIKDILDLAQLKIIRHENFTYGLNNLFFVTKK